MIGDDIYADGVDSFDGTFGEWEDDVDIVNLINENDDCDSTKRGAFEYDDTEDDDVEDEFKEEYTNNTEDDIIIMKKNRSRSTSNIKNNKPETTRMNKIPRINDWIYKRWIRWYRL